MPPIPANPELLTWARERAGLDVLALALALAWHFSKLISGELRIADAEKFMDHVDFTESTATRSVS